MRKFICGLIVSLIFVFSPNIISTVSASPNAVEYTAEEKQTLEKVRAIYSESVELFNSADDMFDVQPDISKLPLVAGKMNDNVAEASAMYLNAIRVGGGLPQVKWSKEITKAAQHKAALVVYTQSAGLSSGHYPAQPNGVSDEFYKCAMSYMSENLYMAGFFSGHPINSIYYALNDGYGDPVEVGHRYNLLNPYATEFGIGLVGAQGVHKLATGDECNIEMVAWPSKGIMLSEADSGGYWTAMFYKNYTVTAKTAVKVTLLNTSQVWEFIPDSGKSSTHDFRIIGSGKVSFYDESLAKSKAVGNVYEVTISNLEGAASSYTYRSVLENAYVTDTKQVQPAPAPTLTASPNHTKAIADGKEVDFRSYMINDNNYLMLRDIAFIISGSGKQFEVGYDDVTKAISLTSGKPYTTVGGEMAGKGKGDKKPVPTESKIYLDGKELKLTVYTIDGNNYFKLRDVGKALNFNVSWINETVVIDTAANYTDD